MTSSSPRKRFGQHFLRDPQIIQRLVTTIAPRPEQHLVEIGPGKGALTIPLLQQSCRLDVIELDRDLVQELKQQIEVASQLRIYQADALRFDLKQLVTDGQILRIVGNLPYNISTPLLFHLLNYASDIQDMTFMLQKEVVDRLVARPDTSEYGRLSVMLQYYCRMERLFDVGPAAFYPAPKVESSVVQLKPYSTPPVSIVNRQHFAQIVARAFSQRRKMLRNTLKGLLEVTAIEATGINPQARAETLTLEDFAKLANATADDSGYGGVK